MKAAFTLLEVLVAFVVFGVLVAVAIPATSRMNTYSTRVRLVSNLRQIGVAARLYANDHDQHIPGGTSTGELSPGAASAAAAGEQWPALFCAYLSPSDPRVFLDAADPATRDLPLPQVISNAFNNTAFVYNGFDELSVDNQPVQSVSLAQLDTPSDVVLLAQKACGAKAFYVDLLFNPLSSLFALFNPRAVDGGSHYLFVDGSVRFIKQADYSNTLWLVNKNLSLPQLLGGMGRWVRRDVTPPGAPSAAAF